MPDEIVKRVALELVRQQHPGLPADKILQIASNKIWLNDAHSLINVYRKALADACYVIVPREPTEAMELVGENIDEVVTDRVATSKDIWQAMIDVNQRGNEHD